VVAPGVSIGARMVCTVPPQPPRHMTMW
jgi:hypothetical protein